MAATILADDDDDDINPFTSIMLLAPTRQPPKPESEEDHQNQSPLSSSKAGITSQQLLDQNNYYLHSINSHLLIRQLPSQGLSFQLWPAATTLVTLLDTHSSQSTIPNPLSTLFKAQENRPLRILELGSGTGLVGIAAAALLSANVTVTDLPHVLCNLHFNVEANSKLLQVNQGAKVNIAGLSWGVDEDMKAIGKEYDLILGSDVVYHDRLYKPLIKTLRFFLLGNDDGSKKKRVAFVMAHLKRWKKESAFFKMARKHFDVDIIHSDPPSHGARVGVVVYRMVGKCFLSINSVPS